MNGVVGGVFLAVSSLLVRMMGPPPLEGIEAVAGGMATVPFGLVLVFRAEPLARLSLIQQSTLADEPVRYAFTTAAVTTDSRLHRDLRDWSLIPRVVEAGTDLLLYCDRRRAMLVPLEAFTLEQYAELRAFLSAKG